MKSQDQEWGYEPSKSGMAIEAKMGMAIIVILVCAFGFLVYHKFDMKQRGLLQAQMQAASQHERDETVGSPGDYTEFYPIRSNEGAAESPTDPTGTDSADFQQVTSIDEPAAIDVTSTEAADIDNSPAFDIREPVIPSDTPDFTAVDLADSNASEFRPLEQPTSEPASEDPFAVLAMRNDTDRSEPAASSDASETGFVPFESADDFDVATDSKFDATTAPPEPADSPSTTNDFPSFNALADTNTSPPAPLPRASATDTDGFTTAFTETETDSPSLEQTTPSNAPDFQAFESVTSEDANDIAEPNATLVAILDAQDGELPQFDEPALPQTADSPLPAATESATVAAESPAETSPVLDSGASIRPFNPVFDDLDGPVAQDSAASDVKPIELPAAELPAASPSDSFAATAVPDSGVPDFGSTDFTSRQDPAAAPAATVRPAPTDPAFMDAETLPLARNEPEPQTRQAGHQASLIPLIEENNPVRQVAAISENCEICEVKPKDTYWTISQRSYGSARYFSSLALYNQHRISDPRRLRPGMKVLVPPPEILEKRYPELFRDFQRPVKLPSGYFLRKDGTPAYRVGERETLSEISQKHLGRASRWLQIYQMNRNILKDPNKLKPGVVIALPDDATNVHVAP